MNEEINQNYNNQQQQDLTLQKTEKKLPGVFELIKQALIIYKQRWKTLLGIAGIYILAFVVFILFSLFVIFGTSFKEFIYTGIDKFFDFSRFYEEFNTINLFAILSLLLLLILLLILFGTWVYLAFLYAIKDREEKIGIIESFRRSWSKLLSGFWINILLVVIISGGFSFFIIPGIIFSVWFSLALFILVSENLKGMSALLKSREYVRGYWGSVFWRLFVFNFFSSLIRSILTFPFDLLFTFFIDTPLFIAYLFLIYEHLKTLKPDITFQPTKKQKAIFIFFGLIGLLVILVGILVIFKIIS